MKTSIQLFITALLIISITACSDPENTATQIRNINVISASDLVKHDENTIILDVRTPREYTAGHIDGALNINIAEDSFASQVAELDRDMTYIVHCATNVENGRTTQSLAIMQDLGFTKLMNLEGGIVAWEKSGQPMIELRETKDPQQHFE